MEIRISLTEKQKEFLRTVENTPVTFYGGAKGGGKSHGLRNIMLLRRFQYENSTGAIFRKTYPELEANHIRPIFEQFPFLRKFYNQSKKLLDLPNGSTLEFCYCESEADLDRYQGREYHDLGIEEAGQWTEVMFQRLRGSNRSSKLHISPKTLLTGNPGGNGHAWLKRLFIERRFKANENPADYAFVKALVTDNPALMESDPGYLKRLEAEPNEMLRKAYRDGDWDLMAGQFFTELSRDVHFIKAFNVPSYWNRFGAYDFGFNHPAAFGWFAIDEDGNVYMYRELIKAKTRIDLFAQELKSFEDTQKLYPIVAGHDCWATKNVINERSPPTIAEEFKNNGIILKKANIDRIQGASQLRNYLAWQDLPSGRTKPKFFIMDTCPVTFDCLSRMMHDERRPEDVLKVDAVEGDPLTGDDPYDMVRYALMSRPIITEAQAPNYKWGTEEWAKAEVSKMEQEAEEHFERIEKQDQIEDWVY
jgi:phage terminase large subunit